MIAVFVNMAAVIAGSLAGILLRNKINKKLLDALVVGLALCTMLIGIQSAVGTRDQLCVIVCMVLGIVIGEALRIDDGIEQAGDWIKRKLLRGRAAGSRFTEGFISACVLFCVGSMTIMGSLEAGINHNYSIILAKSTLDLVSSIAFGAAMGLGVTFSALFILLFQGGLTLLAGLVGNYLSSAVVTEMSAVGGVILIGMAINMLGLTKERIKIANMLPAIFLPIAYIPLSGWIGGLL